MASCDETKIIIKNKLNLIDSTLNDINYLHSNRFINMKETKFKLLNLRHEISKIANEYSSILLKDKELEQKFLKTQSDIYKYFNFYETADSNLSI